MVRSMRVLKEWLRRRFGKHTRRFFVFRVLMVAAAGVGGVHLQWRSNTISSPPLSLLIFAQVTN